MKTFSIEQNPIQTIFALCFFFILYHLYFPSLSVFHPCSSMPPGVPTFPREGLSFNLFSLCLLPLLLYLSLSLMLSFDSQRSTFNGSHLLIKYLQVSAALWQGWRETETKAETKKRESGGWCCSGSLRHDI